MFLEIQGCYPLVMSEKKLTKKLQEFLLEKAVEMFGFQVLPILSDSGVWYEDKEVREGRVSWNHGTGYQKEETFEIEFSN